MSEVWTPASFPLSLRSCEAVERRVTRRYRLSGIVDAVARTRTGLAVVLSRRGRIAPARLSLVAGRVRNVRLARILAGRHNNTGPVSYEQGARYGILRLASGNLEDVHAPLPTVIPGQRGVQRATVP
jgi:hypothetical protein